MTSENPAVRLYGFWREFIRYRNENIVTHMRRYVNDYMGEGRQRGVDWVTLREEAEEYGKIRSWQPEVNLDYRLRLHVIGMSDRHLDQDRLVQNVDDFEPVIKLAVKYHYTNKPSIMSLWPNGDFRLERLPAQGMYMIYPRWTFFRTSWLHGQRKWLVDQPHVPEFSNLSGWVNSNFLQDFEKPLPYLERHSFVQGAHYRLEWNGHFWKIVGQDGRNGHYDSSVDGPAHDRMVEAYTRATRRYERYRRVSEKGTITEAARTKIALYVPKHGRMTGNEAINQFSQYLRVYEPVQAHKEAMQHGSNILVTSTVPE